MDTGNFSENRRVARFSCWGCDIVLAFARDHHATNACRIAPRAKSVKHFDDLARLLVLKSRSAKGSQLHKIFHDLLSVLGQHALRVELDSFSWRFPMSNSHDYRRAVALRGSGRDLKSKRE